MTDDKIIVNLFLLNGVGFEFSYNESKFFGIFYQNFISFFKY